MGKRVIIRGENKVKGTGLRKRILRSDTKAKGGRPTIHPNIPTERIGLKTMIE